MEAYYHMYSTSLGGRLPWRHILTGVLNSACTSLGEQPQGGSPSLQPSLTNVEASIESNDELDTRWVEQSDVVSRVHPQLLHDVRTNPVRPLVQLAAVQLTEGVSLERRDHIDRRSSHILVHSCTHSYNGVMCKSLCLNFD